MKVFAILSIIAGIGCHVFAAGPAGPGPGPGPGQPVEAAEPADLADLGEQCQWASDCDGGVCFKQQKFTMYGYCSQTCTDFPDCPTWWTCGTNVENGARACEQPAEN
jgi:hypothetical protein